MVYADDGWSSWGDWLDSGTIATYKVEYRPFEQARAFVRTLGLRSWEDWLDFARSDKRPSDIPIKPERTYAKHAVICAYQRNATQNPARERLPRPRPRPAVPLP